MRSRAIQGVDEHRGMRITLGGLQAPDGKLPVTSSSIRRSRWSTSKLCPSVEAAACLSQIVERLLKVASEPTRDFVGFTFRTGRILTAKRR